MAQSKQSPGQTFAALDFFAGSGLVSLALEPFFHVNWANDNSSQKAAVYARNHDASHFVLDTIENISGRNLPHAALSWASFPCQDLSLAGKNSGIFGTRSGLVWEWLRVMDEMEEAPSLLVAKNVVGLVSQAKGEYFKVLSDALQERDYRVGATLLNGERWVPQSRPRVFVVAVRDDLHTLLG